MVVVQVGPVKIYVAAMEAPLRKRGVETQFTTKTGGKTSLGPNYLILDLMPYYGETGRSRPLIA
jgi:hypothetical protein